MTRQDLARELDRLGFGARLGVAADIYDLLFPAKVAAHAQDACFLFAAEQGCTVLYAPETRTIWFVKKPVKVRQAPAISTGPLASLGRWFGRESGIGAFLIAAKRAQR
jgi:hypothetical protein